MKRIKKLFIATYKTLCALLLIAFMLFIGTSVSPIYNFQTPKPFSGKDIFNPYRNIDTTHCWKRANFHVHTRVKGILNECEFWPEEVYRRLEKFGYDIVTFSNHNEITTHPFDTSLQVNVYEHGYNLFKYHKLVFGSSSVNYFDHLLPILASQKQFQLDLLGRDADIIQINHPLRTNCLPAQQFEKLEGYRLMELDSGRSTENEYWDKALSAGHYSFGLANDDLHYPDRSGRIAVRCNFLCTPSAHYKDILQVLNEGGFYAMRVPDYGKGDWELKYKMNKQLPFIKNIGLQGNTIYLKLSVHADSIKFTGESHRTLSIVHRSDSASYTMQDNDSYTRITAYFPQGEVIYTNPFARYDASVNDSPFTKSTHSVNYPLTILFNLLLIALFICVLGAFYKLIIKK
ncbi:MAG: hypothetical protein J6B31_03950 [Bacteroidaceae bacterium]|nr:hypothetical protein [Bacteroidaceae bacterium]